MPSPSSTPRRRRWPWMLALAVLGAIVVGVVVARELVYRDRSRRVTTEQALSRFREEAGSSTSTIPHSTTVAAGVPTATAAPSSAAPVPALPAPGVYRYRTTGEESVDVLGGAHHAYPAETTITVTADGCGVRLRWDVLQERRDEWRLCLQPTGITEPWALQYHEFFKQPDPEQLVCPANTLLLPVGPRAGQAWPAACQLAGDDEPQRFEVIGVERLTVGAAVVDAVHVRQSVMSGGDLYEHTVNDWWLAPDGLAVRGVETKTSKSSSPIGPVTYKEHYEIVLESLTPLH